MDRFELFHDQPVKPLKTDAQSTTGVVAASTRVTLVTQHAASATVRATAAYLNCFASARSILVG